MRATASVATLRSAIIAVAVVLTLVLAGMITVFRSMSAPDSAPGDGGSATASAPGESCAAGENPIVCENARQGAPARDWEISGAGDPTIQGFATDISVNVGGQIDFKVSTDALDFTVDIYRTGFYDGLGARKVAAAKVTATLPQVQPACVGDPLTALYDCGSWSVSASWDVPGSAVSGVYLAIPRRSDTGGRSHITFVVRDDASHSSIVMQTSDSTWQAYNTYGGADFSDGPLGAPHPRAFEVSYNRPVLTRGDNAGRDSYFGAEYPMVRFLESNGYDVTYQAGVDTDRSGKLLTRHQVFLSVGHDEYWSGAQRDYVEAARDAGVNLAFFSGSEVYWRTRYESAVAGDSNAHRTLVSYQETWADEKIDPSPKWTGTWRDPRFAPTSAGAGLPENGLTGTMFMAKDTDLPVTVSAAEGRLRLWRHTSLAQMSAGESAVLAPHTVGYESNEDVDNASRPAGLIRLSTTTGAVPEYLQDFGSVTAPGTTTHHLTLYRAASGALVFSAGSIQWSWGLDQNHDGAAEPPDARMQQATVNLLADMGAQPGTLVPGLAAATASTDSTGPTATITGPADGTPVANSTAVTVTGEAADLGGGVVAGVEVSTDGGERWHPATGTTRWTYAYVQTGVGAVPILARAVDDSANIGEPSVARTVAVSCPCGVLGSTVPAMPAADDVSSLELGLRVTPSQGGFITGIRFYKGAGNTGPHSGSLWSADGARLATVGFAAETETGWQSASFATPVAVSAGETYTVSYSAPGGRYAATHYFFSAAGLNAPPLTTSGGFEGEPAGVFGPLGTFPQSTFRRSNYYVDVVFMP